jgi:hypothetical protein
MAARSLKYVALWMGALATLTSAAGCAEDGVSLHVICPILPELEEDSCVWDPAGEDCVAEGMLNLAGANSYRLSLRVQSGLRPRAREDPPQGEPNGIQVRSAEVEMRTADGARISDFENPFTVTASGFVAPGGLGAVTLTALDAVRTGFLHVGPQNSAPKVEQVVLAIKLKGKTNGGQDVSSGEFAWPVRLISKSLGDDGQCMTRPYCAGGLGQDTFAETCAAGASM